jgi:hypothetical protein
VTTASQLPTVSSPSGKNAPHPTSSNCHRQKMHHQNTSAVSLANESSEVPVSSSSATDLAFTSPASLQARPFTSTHTKSSASYSGASEVAQSSSTSESSHTTVQHFVPSPLKSLENATNNLSVYTGSNASNVKLPVSQTIPDNTVTTSSNHGPVTSTSVHSFTPAQTVSSSGSTTCMSSGCRCESIGSAKPTLDTRALAEASRNLTQTLKQLSSEVLTPRPDQSEVSADSH